MSALNQLLQNKICIFDFDGTLADSMPMAVQIVLSLLDEQGISYPADIVKTLTPLGFKGISKYYAQTLGVPMQPEEIFQWFTEKLKVAYATQIPLKEGVKEVLLGLKKQGIKTCVLTGSPHIFTDPCLQRTGIFDLFDKVWSSDDFGILKSNPRIYEEVAKVFDVKVSDLVLIDDGLEVLKTAKGAGVTTIGAYDAYSASVEELKNTAENYLISLLELV